MPNSLKPLLAGLAMLSVAACAQGKTEGVFAPEAVPAPPSERGRLPGRTTEMPAATPAVAQARRDRLALPPGAPGRSTAEAATSSRAASEEASEVLSGGPSADQGSRVQPTVGRSGRVGAGLRF